MESLDIQAFSFEQRQEVLQRLTAALIGCGAWVTERQPASTDSIEFDMEIRLRMVLDIYSVLVSSGVELSRSGHDILTDLCTIRKYISLTSELGQFVELRLRVRFLNEINPLSLLSMAQTPC